ncbi:inositol hexakisphosphate and diphosphoinositol-pentakisphosphate kinase, partial [Haematococcus lacustris]
IYNCAMRKLFGRLTRWTGSERKVSVGVCAMDKKAKSKQMQEILDRLTAFGEFTIVHFSDDILLNKPIEEWPICDTLLSWHSDGFPLAKAEAYAALRRPFCINDLSQQHNLQRRFAVYKTLVAHNIPVPTHIIVQRSGPGEEVPGFVETEDYVELNGTRITKPFVEKPENAEDHNVHIYYPSSLGGGVKKLFRKINNKSSEFDVNHSGRVRRCADRPHSRPLPHHPAPPSWAHAPARHPARQPGT